MQPFITRLRPATFGLAAAALFAQAATAAPTVTSDRGTTSVALSADLINAATALNVAIGDIEPASVDGGHAFFPFLDAAIDAATAKGEIIHAGGLSLKAGDTTVTLTDFIIDTTGSQPILTGLVTVGGSVAGRVPLFDLGLPALSLPLTPNLSGKVVIRNVAVTLTATAATALNQAFNVTAFAGGLSIGTATVKAKMISALE